MQYLTHQHAGREDTAVTAGHDGIANPEMGMTWNIIHISQCGTASPSLQITEIAALGNGHADIGLTV